MKEHRKMLDERLNRNETERLYKEEVLRKYEEYRNYTKEVEAKKKIELEKISKENANGNFTVDENISHRRKLDHSLT